MDCRLYIDEVGNADLDGAATDPNVRYLSLTGILTTQYLHDHVIAPKLDAVKSIIPGHTPDNPIVFHRREIMRRDKRFSPLREDRIGTAFDSALLDFVRSSPYLAMTVQIDKKEHLEMYGAWHFAPYHYCMRCIVERYVLYLNRHNLRGSVIIEPRGKTPDKKLKTSFELIYERGTENIPARTVRSRLSSKSVHFSQKSDNVAGIQMADLIAHPSARYMRFLRDGIAQPKDFGSRISDILVEAKYSRNPKTMSIHGWGTKWLPK